ncbi:hypothetical protein JZ751_011037 [Albula glossodonta]|uniref:Uncharacterized protein n=1 Tax=Albula glossodonta TaxID=121402 RepID=A0A8T2P461_9TELE|nr:hypothetical protein JZ751_011037 [Albula glossodonta]
MRSYTLVALLCLGCGLGAASYKLFVKHEWIKHGTCAVQSETLDTEHKYFSKALELYSKLDLDGTLKTHNIVPSETYYMGEQILGQIEICFSKDYTLMDCQTSEEDTRNHPNDILSFQPYSKAGFIVCDRNIKVYYPPVNGKP